MHDRPEARIGAQRIHLWLGINKEQPIIAIPIGCKISLIPQIAGLQDRAWASGSTGITGFC
jgi:hypothetical protein